MAKDRVQVPDLYKDRGYLPTVRPTASPVDTFHRSMAPIRDTRLAQIAGAFSDIQPGLSKFLNERQEVQNDKSIAEGFAKAQASKLKFKEAVQKGLIPAGANPWYRVGWERQDAQVASLQYDEDLKAAYASSGLSQAKDSAKVQAFVADFTKKWHESHPENQENAEFTRIFAGAAAQSHEALANQHASDLVQKIEADVIQNTALQLDHTLEKDGGLLGSYSPSIGDSLAEVVKVQIDNGLDGRTANKLVAESVIRQAVTDGDINTLDILMDVPSGSGTVGQIGWVKDAVAQARDQIAQRKNHNDRVQHLRGESEKKEYIQSLRAQANQKIFKDPYADISEEFALLNAADADEGLKLESWRTAYLGSLNAQNKVRENDEFKTDILIKALKGDLSEEEVVSAVKTRQIDADTAKDLLTNHIPKAKEVTAFTKDPEVARGSSRLRQVIIGNENSMGYKNERYSLANEAELLYLRGMKNYIDSAKDRSPKERATFELDKIEFSQKLIQTIQNIPEFLDSADKIPSALNNMESRTQPDPAQAPLFENQQSFEQSLSEYLESGGSSGKLFDFAKKYGVDPMKLIEDQTRLISQQSTQPKPKSK